MAGFNIFELDVWGVKIGVDGTNRDVLAASADGKQNLQPVTVYFPHPAGEALNLQLGYAGDSSPDDLWPSDSLGRAVTSGTPLMGGPDGPSIYSFDVGADDIPFKTFWVGATDGRNTYDVLGYKVSGHADEANSTTDFKTQESDGDFASALVSDATGVAVGTADGVNEASDISMTFQTVNDAAGDPLLPVGYPTFKDREVTSQATSNLVEVDFVYPTNGPTGSSFTLSAMASDFRFWNNPFEDNLIVGDTKSRFTVPADHNSPTVAYAEMVGDDEYRDLQTVSLAYNGFAATAIPKGVSVSVDGLLPADPGATIPVDDSSDGSGTGPSYATVHLGIPSNLPVGATVTLSVDSSVVQDVNVYHGVPGSTGSAAIIGHDANASSHTWIVGDTTNPPPSNVFAVRVSVVVPDSTFFTLTVAAAAAPLPPASQPTARVVATQPASVPGGLLVGFDGTWDFKDHDGGAGDPLVARGGPWNGSTVVAQFEKGYNGTKSIHEPGVGNGLEHKTIGQLFHGGFSTFEAGAKVEDALTQAIQFFSDKKNAQTPVDITGFSTGCYEATAFANALKRGIAVPWQAALYYPWIRWVGLVSPVRTNLDTIPLAGVIWPWSSTLPIGVGACYEALYDDSYLSKIRGQYYTRLLAALSLPDGAQKEDLLDSLSDVVDGIDKTIFLDHTVFSQTDVKAAAGTPTEKETNWTDTHGGIGVNPDVLATMIFRAQQAGVPVKVPV